MSFSTICRWVAKFQSGQKQLKDTARPGRPVTSTTPDLAPCDYFLFPRLKNHLYIYIHITREKRLDLPFISVLRVYMLKTMKNAF